VFNSMLPMNCYYGRVEGNEIYVVSNGKSGEYEVDEVREKKPFYLILLGLNRLGRMELS